MNRQSMQNLRLDRRLIDRGEWISRPELDSELEALPDVGHKGMTLGQAEDDVRGEPRAAAAAAPLSTE